MKNYFLGLALALFALSPSLASASAFDVNWSLQDSGDSTTPYSMTIPGSQYGYGDFYLLGVGTNGTDYQPHVVNGGDQIQYNGSYLTVQNVAEGSVIGLLDELSSIHTSVSTTTEAITSLVSSLSSLSTTVSGLGGGSVSFGTSFATFLAGTTTGTYLATPSQPGLMSTSTASKMASLATVATSASYNDLTNRPSIGVAYEGTTLRTGAFPIFKSATVSSGSAVVNFTSDGTSGGTALCTNGVIQDSVSIIFSDSTSSFQQGWAFSNSNKTLTVTSNKFTSANILSGILGQAAANGSVAKITVWCY